MNEKNFIVSDEELKMIESCLLQRKMELEENVKRYEYASKDGNEFYTGYLLLTKSDLSIVNALLKRVMFWDSGVGNAKDLSIPLV